MGWFETLIIGVVILGVAWLAVDFANDSHWTNITWIPDFPLTIKSETTNINNTNIYNNGSGSTNNEHFNLALELEDHINVFNLWAECANRGGVPVHNSEEVSCRSATFTLLLCQSAEAQVVENSCTNVYHATWKCDPNTGFVGCFYKLT